MHMTTEYFETAVHQNHYDLNGVFNVLFLLRPLILTNLQASLSILDPALRREVCRLGTVVASIEARVVAEWKRDDELSRVLNDLQQHTRIQFGRDTNDDNRMSLFVALVINKVRVYRGYYLVEWNRILFQIQWRDY